MMIKPRTRTGSRSARRLAAVAAATTAIALAMSGCGTPAAEPTAAPSRSDVSLRVIVYTSNPDQLALLNSLADEFMKQTPAVTSVTFESINAQDLDTKLTAELQTSDAPDASWMSVEDAKRYSSAGALVDLAPTFDADEAFDYEDLIPAFQTAWVDGDAQYGMPFSTSPEVLYYNADMFRAAGVPTPDEMIEAGTWDWQHLREASKAIAATQGVPGFTPKFDNIQILYPLMYAYNASPWNESSDACTMQTPEMEKAMTLLHDMMYKDGSTSLPGQTSAVFDGSAASSIAFLSSVPLLKDAAFQWGVVPTPAGPDGYTPTVGQSAYVAFTKGEAPELAAQLIAYITNAANSEKLAAYWVPSRASLLTAERLHEVQPLLSVDQFEPIVQGALDGGKVIPVATAGSAAGATVLKGLNEFLFTPDADVDAAMESICGDLDPVLNG
jgi:multiple sugar transport system substrate-binding protein